MVKIITQMTTVLIVDIILLSSRLTTYKMLMLQLDGAITIRERGRVYLLICLQVYDLTHATVAKISLRLIQALNGFFSGGGGGGVSPF